ncbi:MAG: winged helix-turn-helix domain-containing tetratricopeptide repeat protein [Pseudolabrys sp.]
MADDELGFGPFRLEPAKRALMRGNKPVRLGNRAFDILCALTAAHGDLVSKDALMAAAWPGQIVEENAIQAQVSALRKALDEERTGTNYIMTVPGRGYRLIASTTSQLASDSDETPPRDTAPPEDRSIAVLPFQNLSSDPEQEYFVDGTVEDIIAGLSRISWLSVIARNSTFTYKGKAFDVKQISRDLGVRYLLGGSVRKSGPRVRVTVQLIDTATGAHLWSQRYDRQLDDIFALQDEITMSVVGAIEPNLRKAELKRIKRKRPDSLDAYDLVLQALPYAYSHMPDKAAIAIPLLEKALAIEPNYAAAHAPLALCYHARYGRAGLREEDRLAAIRHAHAAISSDGDDAIALGIAGFVVSVDERDHALAQELFERALTLSNSNALSLSCSSLALAWQGKTAVAIERAEQALRLNPFDPLNYLAYNALAISHFHLRNYEQARDAARRSVKSNPQFGMSHAFLAAVLVRLGQFDEARIEAQKAVAADPNFSIGRFSAAAGLESNVITPFADAWHEAGIPDD